MRFSFPLWIAAALSLAGAAAADTPTAFEVLLSSPETKTFAKAAEASGMDLTIKSKPGITVFAPTNAAFAKMGQANLNALMRNPSALRRMVGCHILAEKVTAGDLYNRAAQVKGGIRVRSIGGCVWRVTGDKKGQLHIGGATVVKPNLKAENGLVNRINQVLK